jgi:hypothetical protein
MSFEIKSRVIGLESGRGVGGLTVEAYDADVLYDDRLGVGETDSDGGCRIPVRVGFFSLDRPDVYLLVKSKDGRVLASTRGGFLHDVTKDISMEVPIPCFRLVEAGVLARSDLPLDLASVTVAPALRALTLNPSTAADPLRAEVERDQASAATVLELLKQYMEALRAAADNQAPAFQKLGKLFQLGRDLPALEGHHYGVALGLRLSGETHPLSRLDNVVGLLWGATLQNQSPWVGKSFRRADQAALRSLVGTQDPGPSSGFLGINHFNQLAWHPANSISFHALTWWLNLQDAPPEERRTFGYDRNGGHFVAGPAPSVCEATPRQVFSLNYRWPALGNRPPLSWLVDEMVQIAEGLYLGQLLFTSRRLLGRFDARRPPADYAYQHMGYFSLWDPRWNREARRLFPFLEVPVTAPGLVANGPVAPQGSRYRDLKFDSQPPANCNDRVLAELQADLAGRETVLHLLRDYSDKLQDSLDNSSPLFLRLQELFNRAAPVNAMRGFYRGALVSWHGAGLLDLFSGNTLDLAWKGFAGRFSTWTGKSFDPISRERLVELTDGFETGELPSTWGANTQALRTMKEREVGHLMKLANIWSEPASQTEAVNHGYDVKNFFFIAHTGTSVNANCPNKRIYQFNYRWPKLRTIPPDRFCIDELVQIADGLYLGQLMYATDWLKAYDPREPPAAYRYGMFGYFLLMEEDWHQLRLRLGFDLDNV